MKVYVVITNGEINGEVEGVYSKYKDAQAKMRELVKELESWAEEDEVETDIGKDFYCMTNFDQDEYNEVKIVEKELQ